MSKKNIGRIGLTLAILTALGSWGMQHTGHGHTDWLHLLDPRHIFSLVGVVGSVWGGWFSGVKSK